MKKGDFIINSFPSCSRLFPFCCPLLSGPAPWQCFLLAPSRLSLCPAAQGSPLSTDEKMYFLWRAALFCSCVHFSAIVWFFPKSKQSSSIPEHKDQTVVGGRNIYKPVNLLPPPVYSSCCSRPFIEWPINSRLMAHSDGADFSYLRWHSQISKYFLVKCSIWFSLLFNS